MQRVWLALVALCLGLAVRAAYADDFFSSSPGPLTNSHADLDNQGKCNECHVDGTRDVSKPKCIKCHENVNSGKGFHSSSTVKSKSCEACHHEHKGKGYDLMGWKSVPGGKDSFDHDLTGWKLNGKHAATQCDKCHKTKDKHGFQVFIGTDKLCGSANCHANDQPHKFQRKEMLACERCHTESVWKPEKRDKKFDHNDRADAAMPLIGSHEDVACAKCHPKAVFNLPFQKPDNCGNAGCHQSIHDGHLFGQRPCEWCHSPSFKSFAQKYNTDMPFFDHSERTRFDLGAHKKLKCYDCHTKALGLNKPVAACEQCHAKDSHHADRFKQFGSPPKCGTCHPTTGWKPTAFRHSTTGFPLEMKHAEASCRACHRGKSPDDFEVLTDLVKGKTVDCMGCHEHKNVHDRKFSNGQCYGTSGCHVGPGNPNTNTTAMVKVYHGPNSKFPLVKGHKDVPCAECHTGRKGNKTTFEKIPSDCSTNTKCHEDSLHRGTLGKNCTACHSPGIWDALRFDHDQPFPEGSKGKVDSFPLKGAHKDNSCESCHPTKQYVEANTSCSDEGCHADDDAHKGRLGKQCEKCHVETGDNIFNHNTMSAFRIDGGHLKVRCTDCHPSETFKPRPKTCFGCHPEPAVHKGQYGTGCEQCHSTRTWEDIKPLHDVGDFSLKGAHDNIACERCHRDNRPLAGSGNLCINCHRQDDIHSNALSPRCGECHTQWSFAPAKFDHSRVGCNLTGIHRTVACFDCHRNGNFSAMSPMCASCHIDDAQKHGGTHTAYTTCTGPACHNPNAWTPQVGFNRESVCR